MFLCELGHLEAAMQESDLLAFHIAISIANPSAAGSGANRLPLRLEWLLES